MAFSSPPTSPPVAGFQRPRRPAALAVVLFLGWFLGLGGTMAGCGTLKFYESNPQLVPVDPAGKLHPKVRSYFEAQQKARVESLTKNHRRMVPLAAANFVLSALLVWACARALSMHPGSHLLARQALLANLAFAIVDYVASAPVRHAIIQAGATHPLPGVDLSPDEWAERFRLIYRLALILEVAILGLGAWMLTRPTIVRLYQPESPTPGPEA